MSSREMRIEQTILEHQARLKHFDELLEQAEQGINTKAETSEFSEELAQLRREREKLLEHIEQLKSQTREEWQESTIEEAGPMIIWEAVAKRLESLVERIGR